MNNVEMILCLGAFVPILTFVLSRTYKLGFHLGQIETKIGTIQMQYEQLKVSVSGFNDKFMDVFLILYKEFIPSGQKGNPISTTESDKLKNLVNKISQREDFSIAEYDEFKSLTDKIKEDIPSEEENLFSSIVQLLYSSISIVSKLKIAVVIFAKNEQNGIKPLINELLALKNEESHYLISEVYVVDGKSTDKTAYISKKLGANVIEGTGEGKGKDFQLFLKNCDLNKNEIYIMMDGDYSYDPQDVEHIIAPLTKEDVDVVIGDRFSGNNWKKIGISRVGIHTGNRILSGLAGKLYNQKVNDLCTGYWAFKKKVLENIEISSKRFELEADLFIQLTKKGYKFEYVPINYRPRIGTPQLNRLDFLHILSFLFKNSNILSWLFKK